MSDRDQPTEQPPRFVRPWEDDSETASPETEEVSEDVAETATPLPPEEDVWSALESTGTDFDQYTSDDYLAATTREYQGLAEEIVRARDEEVTRQAVAASMPGVGSGLIGFEDVTGVTGPSEEEMEHVEQQRTSDLALRVGSAVVLLALFLGSLVLGGVWFAGFVTVVMVVGLGELYATLRRAGYTPLAVFGFLGLLVAAIGSHRSGPPAVAGAIVGTLVVTAMFYSVVERRAPLENAAVTVLGMAWVSMLSFAIVLGQAEKSVAMVLLVVLVTAGFDMGAYFVGRAFGRRLLAPVISPKKTLEGLAGGVVFAFVLAGVLSTFPVFEPVTFRGSLLLALVVCVFAPLGDAAESVVKRALGVKDMGSLLPGHGGMLDRVDALLFVVPVAYILFERLNYL